MASLTFTEIALIETLVRKKGYIRTYNKRLICNGSVYIKGHNNNIYAQVSASQIKSLYINHYLLTRRIICDGDTYHSSYEIYRPRLKEYACFEQLTAECVTGAI